MFRRHTPPAPNTSYESPAFRKLRLEMEAIGEAKGRAEGEAEGRAKGKREALLAVLSVRERSVSSAQKKRIKECTDLDLLDRWIRRATTASSVDEVLAPEAHSPRKSLAKQARPASRRCVSRV